MFGWDDAINGVMQLANKFIPDPQERDKFELGMSQLKAQQENAQLTSDTQVALATATTNTAEASNVNPFVSGWRPAIGWVCAVSLGLYFVPQFIMAVILWTRLCWMKGEIIPYPVSINDIITLTLGMLGVIVNRTIEKFGGVARMK